MPRKKSNIHYIYKTTCKVTGRYYIGMHSTCNLEDGYMGSGKRLRYSIRKHGKENHVKEILEFFESRELLVKREREIVTSDLIKDSLCMNIKEGGYGGLKGLSEKLIKKISRAGNEKLRELRLTDKEWSEIDSKKRTNNMKKQYVEGTRKRLFGNKSNTGRKHSENHKNKIGRTNAIKQLGSKNSQYGTCWITKEGVNKKIKKEDLDKWISEGWVKGRDRTKEIWKNRK